jgi:hypothetical protein
MSVIRINGNDCATNLFWMTAKGEARGFKDVRSQARELPPAIGVGRFVIARSTNPIQYGVSLTSQPHALGQLSAAAALADAIEGSWAGVFDLPEGYYFVEVRRGFVSPDGGDVLFPRTEAAKAKAALLAAIARGSQNARTIGAKPEIDLPTIVENASSPAAGSPAATLGLKKFFAPEEFAIPGAGPSEIGKLLPAPSRWVPKSIQSNRLRLLDTRHIPVSLVLKSLPAVAVIGALWYLGPMAWDWLDERINPPEVKVEPHTADPWEKLPPASAMLAQCTNAILDAPELPATTISAVECKGSSILVTYMAASPIAPELLLEDVPAPGCQLEPGPKAGVALRCTKAPLRGIGRQHIWNEATASKRLWETFGAVAGLELGKPVTLSGMFSSGPAVKSIAVTVRSDFPLDDLDQMIGDLPAFTLASVIFTSPNTWQFEGTVYVN